MRNFARLILLLTLALTLPAAPLSSAPAATAVPAPDLTSAPLARQQQFYRIFLHSTIFADPGLQFQFRLNGPDDVAHVAHFYQSLLAKPAPTLIPAQQADILDPWDHFIYGELFPYYLHWLRPIDHSKLNPFYHANLKHYPPPPVSAYYFVVPHGYHDDPASSTSQEIADALTTATFPRVAYSVTDTLGNPTTGLVSDIAKAPLEPWVRTALLADTTQKPFGPLPGPTGDLYGYVLNRPATGKPGYETFRDQVEQDYRRLWAKKLEREHTLFLLADDKVTTYPYDLHTSINPGDPAARAAYSIANTTVTFARAQARYPNRMGDMTNPAFWHSIRDRALLSDLIRETTIGQELRHTPEYSSIRHALTVLAGDKTATATLKSAYPAPVSAQTTATASPEKVSLYIVRCAQPVTNTTETMTCRRKLQAARERLKTEPPPLNNLDPALEAEGPTTPTTIDALSREQAVASRGLQPRQSSAYYTEGNHLGFFAIVSKQLP